MTSSDLWDEDTAARYDTPGVGAFAPEVLEPAVDVLEQLAGGGPVLELAIGTGRVAIPLARRGLSVTGIELSAPMVARLREKASRDDDLPVVAGDMASATAPGCGGFSLVYLVYNTIGNLRTQDEQVACVANAARHLAPGGRFVVEVGVPALRRLPPGQSAVPFEVSADHTGFDTYDPVTQEASSHHFTRTADGHHRYGRHRFRYVWPSELDLMARLAGMTLEHRWSDWHRSPFTAESEQHVSVWRRT